MSGVTTVPSHGDQETHPTGRPVDRFDSDGRPVRDCRCPSSRPHGTLHGYLSDRCRCRPCTDARAAAARARRRLTAYGRAVPRSVPNVGTRRRVEALQTVGWSMREISRRLGWSNDRLMVMLATFDGISPRNAARVAGLYDELWNTPPPRGTRGERIAASRARLRAERFGFAPPMAWADVDMDDPLAFAVVDPGPVAEPVLDEVAVERLMAGTLRLPSGTGPGASTPLEVVEAVRRLAARGLPDSEIGDRVGKSGAAVMKIRDRHGIPAAVRVESVVPRRPGRAA